MTELNPIELRPYQKKLIPLLRTEFKTHNRVFLQLATGAGKTVIISQITKTAFDRKFKIWFIVPRNELLEQSKQHFYKWNIPFATIQAGKNESRAFKIHIISKDTLLRRIKSGKIKNYPDFCIFDEGHIAIDQQKFIIESLPENTKFLGVSATPERADGRGLSDIYQSIIYGPNLKNLIQAGYLANFRYFCPPIAGINTLHRKGTEYDADELKELFKRRAVYGKAINHYREYANEKPCIVFCRNIIMAEETAKNFRAAGYRFESIDGKMNMKKRRSILEGLRSGALHGITSVDLVIYGLDVPSISCIIMLRPTLSKAVFFQMIGRALRPEENKIAIILDHVNNFHEHIDREKINKSGLLLDGFNIDWKFYGKSKRQITKKEIILKFCEKCFCYFQGNICENCGHIRKVKKQKELKTIEGKLKELKSGPELEKIAFKDSKEFHDRIAIAKKLYYDSVLDPELSIDLSAIKMICDIAKEAGYGVMWVYHNLNNLEKLVNIPLLHAIKKVKNYNHGWIYFQKKELKKRISKKIIKAS